MNPTLYALCQESVLGPALWLIGQCSIPPLIPDTTISLDSPGLVLSREFTVPVSRGYFLSLGVEFPTVEDRLTDRKIGAQFDFPCYGQGAKRLEDFPVEQRLDLGQPIRLQVTALNVKDGSITWKADLASICRAGHDGKKQKLQVLALPRLSEGRYRLTVHNVEARPDLAGLGLSLLMHSGDK